ncbi:MAG: hypothetical protein NZ908_00420 [Candidatus Micrarchaeota archaeon]|nr:hypothetical protein [Candidatus Micrarchaeota archaeon]MCX8154568.1 hypothetical protein [Candidatus Micrarchaeota archaeon]
MKVTEAIKKYREYLQRDVNSMQSIYRKLRKPQETEVRSLFNQIVFVTIAVGVFGIFVTFVSVIFDLLVRGR